MLGTGDLWSVERLLRQFELPLTLLRPGLLMETIAEHRRCAAMPTASWCCACRCANWPSVHRIAADDVGALVRLAFDRPGAFGPRSRSTSAPTT